MWNAEYRGAPEVDGKKEFLRSRGDCNIPHWGIYLLGYGYTNTEGSFEPVTTHRGASARARADG